MGCLPHRGRLVWRGGGRRRHRCPLALGTDGGVSIRIPAACCGVVGLKPTLGRVPHVHQVDLFSSTFYTGLLARSVREVCAST